MFTRKAINWQQKCNDAVNNSIIKSIILAKKFTKDTHVYVYTKVYF